MNIKRKDITLPDDAWVVTPDNPEAEHFKVTYRGKEVRCILIAIINGGEK